MARFCVYCGKELVDGRCDCAGFLAEEATRVNTAAKAAAAPPSPPDQGPVPILPQGAPSARSYQSAQDRPAMNAQPAGQQNSAPEEDMRYAKAPSAQAGEAAKDFFSKLLGLMLICIKSPVQAAKKVTSSGMKIPALTIGGVYILLLFLSLLIHMPLGESAQYVVISRRALFALGVIVTVIVAILLTTAGYFLFQKLRGEKVQYSFIDLLGMFLTLTVPGILVVVLSFILGFFAPGIAAGFYILSIILWVAMAASVIMGITTSDEDGKSSGVTIIFTAVAVLTLVIGYVLLRGTIGNMIQEIMEGISKAQLESMFEYMR